MPRVVTFSTVFPSYHPRKGQKTYFHEALQGSLYNNGYDLGKYLNDQSMYMQNNWWNKTPKNHTIRAGSRWKPGDVFSPRIWSGKPYASKQISIAPNITILKVWSFEIKHHKKKCLVLIDGVNVNEHPTILQKIAKNDGLSYVDLLQWFKYPKPFQGQIICWDKELTY